MSDQSKLTAYLASWKQNMPTFNGKEPLMAAIQAGATNILHRLLTAFYSSDLSLGCNNLVPPLPEGLVTVRNSVCKIISIKSDVEEIDAGVLERLKTSFGRKYKGSDCLIWDTETNLGGLSIPTGEVVVTHTTSGTKDAMTDRNVYNVITQEPNRVLSYLDVKAALKLMSYEYVNVRRIPMLLKSLNECFKHDETFQLMDLSTLTSIASYRDSSDKHPQSVLALLDACEAALYDFSPFEDKVAVLEKKPSLEFAAKLNLPRPYTKTLYSNGRVATRVKLVDCRLGDKIVVQKNLTMDPGYLKNTLKPSTLVYLHGPSYVEKVNRGAAPKPIQDVFSAEAALFLRVANCVSTLGDDVPQGTKRAADTPEAVSDKEPALKKVKFNI